MSVSLSKLTSVFYRWMLSPNMSVQAIQPKKSFPICLRTCAALNWTVETLSTAYFFSMLRVYVTVSIFPVTKGRRRAQWDRAFERFCMGLEMSAIKRGVNQVLFMRVYFGTQTWVDRAWEMKEDRIRKQIRSRQARKCEEYLWAIYRYQNW
jgi:hypothetical protein